MACLALIPAFRHFGHDFGGLLKIARVERQPGIRGYGETVWNTFRFYFTHPEISGQFTASVPFDYSDGEWALRTAGLSQGFPIELRAAAFERVKMQDPFAPDVVILKEPPPQEAD